MKHYFYPTDIYLPDFDRVDGNKWAVVACDQFTSQREYWRTARAYVDGTPSTLDLMLPEAYLDRAEEAVPLINGRMQTYLDTVLIRHENTMVYLERTQSDGRIRRGIVGAIDLEDYDYTKGASTLIRATEGTVLSRIPPRVAIRRGAVIEMPHIMILIDDPKKTVIEPVAAVASGYPVAYDFDLMAGGGHVKGCFLDGAAVDSVNEALGTLATKEAMAEKYGVEADPLLFAMGDGNHSLATAKALYEEIKAELGAEAAKNHPARYALCEIVNLHDDALEFEPIYRIVCGVDAEAFHGEFASYLAALSGSAEAQEFELFHGGKSYTLTAPAPEAQLAVGTAQDFLDAYVERHPAAEVDYIHGADTVRALAAREDSVAILFDGMGKDMLFKTVICDGALPRKTFSMGHAEDKRYYVECRKIR